MGANLKFNSAICTSRDQSERLLALGLKKETADMTLQTALNVCYTIPFQEAIEYFEDRHLPPHPTILPAWSLHRLIEMANTYIEFSPFTGVYFRDGAFSTDRVNAYDAIIDIIEWLIKEEDFNKEYLTGVDE